jgi:large subunit ribosomal protein L10
MARADKEKFIASMQGDLSRAMGVLFVDYTGLTVDEADKLRKKLRDADVAYKVVKNSLMRRALSATPFADAEKCLRGTPTGVVLGFEDPVTAAKLTYEFLKDCEHLKVKGGVVDNKAISVSEVEALSKLPSKEELQGAVVGLAMSPGRNLAGQLKHSSGKLVGAIEALVTKLEEKA